MDNEERHEEGWEEGGQKQVSGVNFFEPRCVMRCILLDATGHEVEKALIPIQAVSHCQ